MASILKTTSLGNIQGKTHDGITQYLGLRYATLRNRLADAELLHTDNTPTVHDATKDGPTAISPPFGCDLELGHVQHPLPEKQLPQSDRDCLNLNIAVPEYVSDTSNLPVFAFIHGGGLVVGANSWPQFEYTRFVKLSVERGLPIVAVSINYRLGAPGFLTSDELRTAGYKPNNGLRDQKVALQWIQSHIRDFGGDPENVTLAGMSAGGASVTYHLHSEDALFARAIIMSGTWFLTGPLGFDDHERNYWLAMEALGLKDKTGEERVKALLEMPAEDLLAKLPPSVLIAPAIDGDMVLSHPTHSQVVDRGSTTPKGKRWCKDLMIGDAQMDASIITLFMSHLKGGSANRFITAMTSTLSSGPAAGQILQAYGITKDMADEEAFSAIVNYINDISFFAPVLSFAQGWPGNVYVYYFNEGNPWDGPWKGRASHILDLAYLFQNFQEYMTPTQRAVGTAFAEDIFKFCHGVAPWSPTTGISLSGGFVARTYGPSEKSTIGEVKEPFGGESLRRRTLFDHPDVSLDELARVLAVFKAM